MCTPWCSARRSGPCTIRFVKHSLSSSFPLFFFRCRRIHPQTSPRFISFPQFTSTSTLVHNDDGHYEITSSDGVVSTVFGFRASLSLFCVILSYMHARSHTLLLTAIRRPHLPYLVQLTICPSRTDSRGSMHFRSVARNACVMTRVPRIDTFKLIEDALDEMFSTLCTCRCVLSQRLRLTAMINR